MIVAGEGEGPLSPTAKKTGILLAGYDSATVDALIAQIMGFDPNKILTIANSPSFSIAAKAEIGSNDKELNGLSVTSINCEEPFSPHSGWVGHIELENSL